MHWNLIGCAPLTVALLTRIHLRGAAASRLPRCGYRDAVPKTIPSSDSVTLAAAHLLFPSHSIAFDLKP